MTKKPVKLYKEAKLKEGGDEIKAMAERVGVRKEDVVLAAWKMAKDLVWVQLVRDLRYKKEEEKYLRDEEKEANKG